MNKILLIQSYLGRRESGITFPNGLATIAAHISDKYELRGFDPNVSADPKGDLQTVLKSFRPDLVAISLRNIDTTNLFDPHIYYLGFVDVVKLTKKTLDHVPLVVGGSGFSLFPGQIMEENPEIDFGIYLEGEETFPELLEFINEPHNVKGIFYRENDKIKFTGQRESIQFEETPLPRWDIFDVNAYKHFPYAFGVETKRGCVFQCSYCSYHFLSGHRIRLRNPERVIEEINELRRRFGIKHICFTDSVFNIPVDHALAILDGIKQTFGDVSWIGYLNEQGITRPFVKRAIETGFKVFTISADGCTDPSLKIMGKATTLREIFEVVEILRNTPPAEVGFNFFVNGPSYNYHTLVSLLTLLLAIKLKMRNRFSLLKTYLGYVRVLPGTRIHEMAVSEGLFSPGASLLPYTTKEFEQCFYFNPNLRLFNIFFASLRKNVRKKVRKFRPISKKIQPR